MLSHSALFKYFYWTKLISNKYWQWQASIYRGRMFFSGLICPLWFAYVYKFLRLVALTSICFAIKSQQYFNRRGYVKWNSHKTLISFTNRHTYVLLERVFAWVNWKSLIDLIYYHWFSIVLAVKSRELFPFLSLAHHSPSFGWMCHRTSGSMESLNLCRTSCHNWEVHWLESFWMPQETCTSDCRWGNGSFSYFEACKWWVWDVNVFFKHSFNQADSCWECPWGSPLPFRLATTWQAFQNAWTNLLNQANRSVHIGAFYFTLRDSEFGAYGSPRLCWYMCVVDILLTLKTPRTFFTCIWAYRIILILIILRHFI